MRFLIVGLAPGVRGANRTGRPFTGDYAGELLYSTLKRFGMARGEFEARPDDSLELIGTAITNAVRCVPPDNKPVGAEINTCRSFLVPTIARFPNLKAILTLGFYRPSVDGAGARRARRGGAVQARRALRRRQHRCVFRATTARATTPIRAC